MEIIREMTTSLTYLGFNKLAIHIFRRLSPIRVNMALLVVGVQVNTLTCLKNFVSKVKSMYCYDVCMFIVEFLSSLFFHFQVPCVIPGNDGTVVATEKKYVHDFHMNMIYIHHYELLKIMNNSFYMLILVW